MRKHLIAVVLLTLSIFSISAQNSTFTANNWVLSELSVNGNVTIPSNITDLNGQDVVLQFTDTGTEYNFDTYVCLNEAIAGTISYPFSGTISEQFFFLNSAQTLGMCCDPYVDIMNPDQDCLDILSFSTDYFNFWSGSINEIYDYEILSIANTVSLSVTKVNGDYALYYNATASLPNQTFSDIFVTQNPSMNTLQIHGVGPDFNSNIEIYDLSGKRFNLSFGDSYSLDVSNYKSGMYLIKIFKENQSTTLKFVIN